MQRFGDGWPIGSLIVPDIEPISLTLTGKLFIQFAGQELIEVGQVDLPFVAAVIATPQVHN